MYQSMSYMMLKGKIASRITRRTMKMMLPTTERMKVRRVGSILREEPRGKKRCSECVEVMKERYEGKPLPLESVVGDTGYSGERKRVSKLRGEVSEG